MWIQAEKMLFEDLRPGDLFSSEGQETWDSAPRGRLPISYVTVQLRLSTPVEPYWQDQVVYRLTIHPDKPGTIHPEHASISKDCAGKGPWCDRCGVCECEHCNNGPCICYAR